MAGGEGKRMNSNLPKVLHPVLGKPMLVRILETVQKVSPSKILIVTGKHHSTIQHKAWMITLIYVEKSMNQTVQELLQDTYVLRQTVEYLQEETS